MKKFRLSILFFKKSYRKIQPSRVVAVICYLFAFLCSILIFSTDFSKNWAILEFKQHNPHGHLQQVEIETKASKSKEIISIIICISIFIDVVFRYLVIESLYQKFREQSKPSVTLHQTDFLPVLM